MAPLLTLAEQIAQLEEAAPDYGDENDVVAGFEGEDGMNIDAEAAREHYIDVGPSALRKLHDSVADPKYDGVRTSRKHLEEDSEVEQDEVNASSEGSGDSEDDEIPSGSDQEQDSDMEEQTIVQGQPAAKLPKPIEQEPTDDLSLNLRKTRDEDVKKGKAVSRQIAIWDTLLDARIRLQKSVTAANKLPTPENISPFLEMPECQASLTKMYEEAALLSEEILELREHLMTSNETVQPPPRKKRRIDDSDESPEDYKALLREATLSASALDNTFHPYLIQTLGKWSSKIQAVAPSVLLPSNRNAFSSKNSQNIKSAVQLVEEILADHSKVLARTQVRRSKGTRLGPLESMTELVDDAQDEIDLEIFDDTDFYQQLLRDVIDSRGNGVAGGDDWMAVQKQKKAKKKVDTKASKGRKLRYEVHERIQNFMVPVPTPGQWHDEQVDELFASLLGRGFENASEAMVENSKEKEAEVQALGNGFRVFG